MKLANSVPVMPSAPLITSSALLGRSMTKRKAPSARSAVPSRATLIRLAEMEIPEEEEICNCPFEWIYIYREIRPATERRAAVIEELPLARPPCRHIRARDHGTSLARWAEVLWDNLGADYWEPPRPARRMQCLRKPARLAVDGGTTRTRGGYSSPAGHRSPRRPAGHADRAQGWPDPAR